MCFIDFIQLYFGVMVLIISSQLPSSGNEPLFFNPEVQPQDWSINIDNFNSSKALLDPCTPINRNFDS